MYTLLWIYYNINVYKNQSEFLISMRLSFFATAKNRPHTRTDFALPTSNQTMIEPRFNQISKVNCSRH